MPPSRYEHKHIMEKLSELFREHGYHGTTLSFIQEASGLGKGSIYHHFANGKEDIARAVLNEIHSWFEENVYQPLEEVNAPLAGLDRMYTTTIQFFRNGNRVCVPGSFALHDARDHFPDEIEHYFKRWVEALSKFLRRHAVPEHESRELALETVTLIQGGLIMARALRDPRIFVKMLERDRKRLKSRLKQTR